MSKNTSISVIIPLYNKESTIARAISSVLNQTVNLFELIIVEGPSSDASNKIVSDFSDERIMIITQTGKGVSDARNIGIQHASNELIAFLDADDEWVPDFLETIISLSQKYPQASMFGTAYSVYLKNKKVHDIVLSYPQDGSILKSYYNDFVNARHPIIITSAFAAKKDALQYVGEYSCELCIGEDHELFAKLALYYPIAYSSKICAKYNLCSENNTDILNVSASVPLEKYLQETMNLPDIIESKDFMNFMNHWRLRIAGRNLYSGFRKEAIKQISQVNKNSPFKIFMMICCLIPFPYKKLNVTIVRKLMRVVGLSI